MDAADLASHASLCKAVAEMVGGKHCVPKAKLSHADLQQLLYHKVFQFSRGTLSRAVAAGADKW